MSLFQCEICGAIENTACSNYHCKSLFKETQSKCSECDPRIGKWHDRFEKRNAHEHGYYTDGRYIYPPEAVDLEKMVWTYNPKFKILGPVPKIPA